MQSLEQSFITHRCTRELWLIAAFEEWCCVSFLVYKEKRQTEIKQHVRRYWTTVIISIFMCVPDIGAYVDRIMELKSFVKWCKMIFEPFSTSYSVPFQATFAVWTQQEADQGKGLHQWKWRMGATLRSAPPPVLMEICQDPVSILSRAHNVRMKIKNKEDNNAPECYSALIGNVRTV